MTNSTRLVKRSKKPGAAKARPRASGPASELVQALRRLQTAASRIRAAAIVDTDGMTIASLLPQRAQERRVGAIAAALLSLGEQTIAEFGHGELERVFIEGENGYTVVTPAGPTAVLTVVAQKDAKVGLVFMQMSRAVEEVRTILSLAFAP